MSLINPIALQPNQLGQLPPAPTGLPQQSAAANPNDLTSVLAPLLTAMLTGKTQGNNPMTGINPAAIGIQPSTGQPTGNLAGFPSANQLQQNQIGAQAPTATQAAPATAQNTDATTSTLLATLLKLISGLTQGAADPGATQPTPDNATQPDPTEAPVQTIADEQPPVEPDNTLQALLQNDAQITNDEPLQANIEDEPPVQTETTRKAERQNHRHHRHEQKAQLPVETATV